MKRKEKAMKEMNEWTEWKFNVLIYITATRLIRYKVTDKLQCQVGSAGSAPSTNPQTVATDVI